MISALQEQNVEIPAGQLGQPPSDEKQAFQIPVRVVGRLSSPEEFDNIIVKSNANGLILLKNVGHAEVGAEDYSSALEYNGHVAQGMGVQQLSNANALDVDRQAQGSVGGAVEELSAGAGVCDCVRLDDGGWRVDSRSAGYAGGGDRDRRSW